MPLYAPAKFITQPDESGGHSDFPRQTLATPRRRPLDFSASASSGSICGPSHVRFTSRLHRCYHPRYIPVISRSSLSRIRAAGRSPDVKLADDAESREMCLRSRTRFSFPLSASFTGENPRTSARPQARMPALRSTHTPHARTPHTYTYAHQYRRPISLSLSASSSPSISLFTRYAHRLAETHTHTRVYMYTHVFTHTFVYAEGVIQNPSTSSSAVHEHCLEGRRRWRW